MTAYSVPPVVRAFKLLRHIAAGDSVVNMSQTARAIGISRTTLIRLIATLEAEQMIEREGTSGGFKLGIGLAGLAGQTLASNDIARAGDPVLQALTDRLSLSSHLGVRLGRDILYVARRTPNVHLVSNVGIGSRLPAHATSIGRIILAYTPRDEVRQLFQGVKLKAATSKTATTLTALCAQIDADRATGLAWSDGNYEAGISSVAAPVFDLTGRVAGAVNVTGPFATFNGSAAARRQIGEAVAAATADISRRLGYVAATPEPAARREQNRRQR